MKTKKIKLLAISTIALAMPLVSYSATAKVTAPNGSATIYDDSSNILGNSGKSALSTPGNLIIDASASILGDGYSISSSFSHLAGTGVVNTYFTVASGVTNFTGDWLASPGGTGNLGAAKLLDISKGTTVALTLVNGQYDATGLVAGDKYDWSTAYSKGSSTFGLSSSIQVSAVPEPEQWAMMMVGLFLVAAKVTKTKKSATLLMPFNA